LQRRPSSPTKDVGSSIRELLNDLGIRHKIAEYEAVLRWESIVGEHIGRVAEAIKIVKGVLVVKVKSGTWRNELSLRKREIIETLNKELGDEIVKDIRFH
jgi:predicted nucleic acid-binding Zn ribbon protein